jgi:hypothetical protein
MAASRTDETYDGAAVVFTNLRGTALAVVETLRRTVNALREHSPLLPLSLSRLADALVLLSRFKESQDQRSGLRQEALSAAQTAAAMAAPHSPYASAIHGSVANVLRWQKPDDAAIAEALETAAKAGAECHLSEGLAAALDWGAIEPLRASAYVDSILHRLQTQLEADGKCGIDLLQETCLPTASTKCWSWLLPVCLISKSLINWAPAKLRSKFIAATSCANASRIVDRPGAHGRTIGGCLVLKY